MDNPLDNMLVTDVRGELQVALPLSLVAFCHLNVCCHLVSFLVFFTLFGMEYPGMDNPLDNMLVTDVRGELQVALPLRPSLLALNVDNWWQ